MDLTARLNGPPRLTGTVLIILCGYRGGKNNASPRSLKVRKIGFVVNLISFYGLRRFVAEMRDHFANPRDLAYMLTVAEAVRERASFQSVELWVDEALVPAGDNVGLPGYDRISVAPITTEILANRRDHDTIVLVYPDALGLTWGALEGVALKKAKTVVIANGRRRLFTLDAQVQRKLAWRRFLANSHVVEMAWGVAIIPFAAALAVYDYLRGRR